MTGLNLNVFDLYFNDEKTKKFHIPYYSNLAYHLDDIQKWFEENSIKYEIHPKEECTKHVLFETEYSKNEYELVGWDVFFESEKDVVHFKLVWGWR